MRVGSCEISAESWVKGASSTTVTRGGVCEQEQHSQPDVSLGTCICIFAHVLCHHCLQAQHLTNSFVSFFTAGRRIHHEQNT